MQNHLVVVIKKSGTAKAEEHVLEPKAALELYRDVKDQRKRRWPEVGISEYVNSQDERGEVKMWDEENTLVALIPEQVFVYDGGELKVFVPEKSSKKTAAKKKKKKSEKKAKKNKKKK